LKDLGFSSFYPINADKQDKKIVHDNMLCVIYHFSFLVPIKKQQQQIRKRLYHYIFNLWTYGGLRLITK
jgi:hypothetical protein